MQTETETETHNIRVGDTVIWLDSNYKVIEVGNKGLKLKQNFSIGTILEGYIKETDVVKVK